MNDLLVRVSERLARLGIRLTLAESCTGGLLAARLTDLPGASRFLVGGLVTYSDEAKVRLLGVRPETLAAFGAVSEPVVREMAAGALRGIPAEAAVAITGVAGPQGGTPEKPVGTVWLAVMLRGGTEVRRLQLEGDRGAVRHQAVQAALELLDRLLLEEG